MPEFKSFGSIIAYVIFMICCYVVSFLGVFCSESIIAIFLSLFVIIFITMDITHRMTLIYLFIRSMYDSDEEEDDEIK